MTGTVLCNLFTGGKFAWVAAGSSVVTLVAIAIERHHAVVYPLGNKGKLTKRKLKVCYLLTYSIFPDRFRLFTQTSGIQMV